MKEVQRATSLVLIAIGALIGTLVLERVEIKDPTLRFSAVQATEILGVIIISILVIRGLIAVFFSRIRAEAPHLYEGVKNLARMIALGLMSLVGCTFVLFIMLSSNQGPVQPFPLGIAAVFAWAAIVAFRRIREQWWTWRAYRRLHTARSRI